MYTLNKKYLINLKDWENALVLHLKFLIFISILNLQCQVTSASAIAIENAPFLDLEQKPVIEIIQEHRKKRVLVSNLNAKNQIRSYESRYESVIQNSPSLFSNISSSGELTLMGQGSDRFHFKCRASYPTKWSSTVIPMLPTKLTPGYSLDLDRSPLERDEKMEAHDMRTSELTLILPTGKSGWVCCEGVNLKENAASIYLYSLDGPNLVESEHLTIVADTEKEHRVPCNANYPNVTAGIISSPSKLMGNQIIGEYDPQKGFLMKGHTFRRSSYYCVYEDQEIKFDFYNPRRFEYGGPVGAHIDWKDPDPDPPPTEKDTLQFRIGGLTDIFCTTINYPVHEIKMISCDSVDECDLLKDCFQNNCTLNGVTRKEAIPMQEDGQIPKFSGTIREPYVHGMVYCQNSQNDFGRAFNYLFTGLDHQRYWLESSDDVTVPEGALIQISKIDQNQNQPKKFQSENSTSTWTPSPAQNVEEEKFKCEIVNFLLIPNLRFVVEYKNGSMFHAGSIRKGQSSVLADNVLGFSRKDLVIGLTAEMRRIYCFVPSKNSSFRWLNASIAVQATVVHSAESVLQTDDDDDDMDSYDIFELGGKMKEPKVEIPTSLNDAAITGISISCIIILTLVVCIAVLFRNLLKAKRQLKHVSAQAHSQEMTQVGGKMGKRKMLSQSMSTESCQTLYSEA